MGIQDILMKCNFLRIVLAGEVLSRLNNGSIVFTEHCQSRVVQRPYISVQIDV